MTTKDSPLGRAKDAVWHVQSVGERYLVSRGEASISEWFGDYRTAFDYAASLNIMDDLSIDFETTQSLIEQAETMASIRKRSRAVVERYKEHPAFQPDNTGEDIFAKMARIIEYEKRN